MDIAANQLTDQLHNSCRHSQASDPKLWSYSSFVKGDNTRCLTLRGIASSLLLQAICQVQVSSSLVVQMLASHIRNNRGWTGLDALQWLAGFQTFHADGTCLYLVLDPFDNCPESIRRSLLQNFLRNYFVNPGGTSLQIIITSCTSDLLCSAVPTSSMILLDCDAVQDSISVPKTPLMQRVDALIKMRPNLRRCVALVGEQLEAMSRLDPLLQRMVLERARLMEDWPTSTHIPEIMAASDLGTTEELHDVALSSFLQHTLCQVPDQPYLEIILALLLYTVRPLTISEIATAISIRQGRSHTSCDLLRKEILVKLDVWLAGIAEVLQGEVNFLHPRIRKMLMNDATGRSEKTPAKYMWDDLLLKAHAEISDICFHSFSIPSTQNKLIELLEGQGDEAHILLTERTNFYHYAIEAWNYHLLYGSTGQRGGVEETIKALKYPLTSQLERILARARCSQSSSFTRTITCPQTLFPVFAGMGISDMPIPEDTSEISLGLMEAASKGRWETVEWILKETQHMLSDSMLLDAMVAAGRGGHEDTILGLIHHIIVAYSWAFRSDPCTERGCDCEPSLDPPLILAAIAGRITTVELLLKYGAAREHTGMGGETALHWAARMNDPVVSSVLVATEEGGETIDNAGFSALNLACVLGSPAVVKALLSVSSGPDITSGERQRNTRFFHPCSDIREHGYLECMKLLVAKGIPPDSCANQKYGTALNQAAQKGWVDTCRVLLDAGADPNHPGNIMPILCQIMYSISLQDILPVVPDLLRLLLSNGADPNAQSSAGRTTLLEASYCLRNFEASVPVCSVLLENGAIVDSVDNAGWTALHMAASAGNQELTRLLLTRGADFTRRLPDGKSALFLSATHPETLKVLLEHGADPDTQANDGGTPLLWATAKTQHSSIQYLLQYNANLELEIFQDGWTALHLTVLNGSPETFYLLAENGANLNHKSRSGECIIHTAARLDRIRSLLSFLPRIEIDKPDDRGYTAMMERRTTFMVLKQLVHAGADVNYHNKDGNGWTPLSLAASRNEIEKAGFLLQHGAMVNHMDRSKGTALPQACWEGSIDMAKLLIKHGADPNISDCYSEVGTALHSACEIGWDDEGDGYRHGKEQEDLVNYLIDEREMGINCKGGLFGNAINFSILYAKPPFAVADFLLAKGARVDLADNFGRLSVHFAALRSLEVLQKIINAGGDIFSRDGFQRTTLHWAAHSAHLVAVEYLLCHLPPEYVDAKVVHGWTPLCYAAAGSRGSWTWHIWHNEQKKDDHEKVVKLLLDYNADPTVRASIGADSWTPSEIAGLTGKDLHLTHLLRNGTSGQTSLSDNGVPNADNALVKLEKKLKWYRHCAYCDVCLKVGPEFGDESECSSSDDGSSRSEEEGSESSSSDNGSDSNEASEKS
ncbi:Ankyrin repeat-containing domain protein [Rhypophila sp. PSN 637]